MIVGTRDIDRASLRKACSSSSELIRFAEALVPEYLRHVDSIVNNQKYLVAINLRGLQGMPYLFKQSLTEKLLDGVAVRGTLSTIVDAEDLLTSVDLDKLFRELFREELKSVE